MLTIKDIMKVCNGKYIGNNENTECKHFSNDTRIIKKDDIYVGIKGETFNGNNFYKEAFNKGAKLCILDSDTIIDKKDTNIILVDDTIKAIQKLAEYKRTKYNIPVVAVTGSVGKTSVRDMIHAVLKKKYNVLCNSGNKNNHIGVPLTILELDNHDAMIIEMGMNHLGEIHTLSNIAKPTIGVITNVGTAHIGNLGSRENILKAKLEILDGMNNGTLIINNDNDLLHTVKYDNLITTGINSKSDYTASDINIEAFSSTFKLEDNYLTIPVGSEAYINNALLAYATGRKLGIDKYEIEDALKNMKLTPHRLEKIETEKITIIDDTYNASLDSVNNAATLLSKVNNRSVFIFADILELDTYGEEIHKEVGKIFVEKEIDIVITIGELSKHTYEVVKNKNRTCYHFNNNKELLKEIDKILRKDDFVLIKGSHAMNLIEIVEYLKNKM
ncbi:MAG: UDP-N-acetylmuramoyl-tripeptide--D-alanyl-D-alanine ligase [Bacilli bacterium]|nr:UDP-N-acetylmuramoyl-tripeptide--D-alanyl-D-alanine ligase [Bacilli bacterium]